MLPESCSTEEMALVYALVRSKSMFSYVSALRALLSRQNWAHLAKVASNVITTEEVVAQQHFIAAIGRNGVLDERDVAASAFVPGTVEHSVTTTLWAKKKEAAAAERMWRRVAQVAQFRPEADGDDFVSALKRQYAQLRHWISINPDLGVLILSIMVLLVARKRSFGVALVITAFWLTTLFAAGVEAGVRGMLMRAFAEFARQSNDVPGEYKELVDGFVQSVVIEEMAEEEHLQLPQFTSSYADQSDFEQQPVVPQSVSKAFFVGIAGLVIGRRVPMFTKLANMSKFNAAVGELYEHGEGAVVGLLNIFLRAFAPHRVIDLRKRQCAAIQWADEAHKFVRDFVCEPSKLDNETSRRFAQLRAVGEAEIAKWPKDSKEWRATAQGLDALMRLAQTYPAQFAPSKTRMEPVGVMLAGPPGAGKTKTLEWLSAYIVAHDLGPEHVRKLSSQVFQKGPSPYWEGYSSQLITTMDDFFAKTAAPGESEGEAELVIKMINPWPLPLNMANCAHKGRYMFESHYVLGTTNIDSVDPLLKAVNTPGAITRRFPFWLDCRRKPGTAPGPNSHPDDFLQFRLIRIDVDVKSGGPEDPWSSCPLITFEELAKKVVESRGARTSHHSATREHMFQYFEEKFRRVPVEPQGGLPSKIAAVAGCTATVAGVQVARAAGAAARFVKQDLSRITKVSIIGAKLAAAIVAFVAGLVVVKRVAKAITGATAREKVEPQAVDEVVAKVQRNIGTVTLGGASFGHCLAIDDNNVVVPMHYHTRAEETKEKLLANFNGHEVYLINLVGSSPAGDIAIYRAKTRCKSLRIHIAPAITGPAAYFVRRDTVVPCRVDSYGVGVTYADTSNSLPQRRSLFWHNAKTACGDCGAVLVSATLAGPRILGIHVGGSMVPNVGHGVFTLLSRYAAMVPEAEFCGHKILREVAPVHNGGASRLIAAPTQGLLAPCSTAPAAKRPVDGIDPMLLAVAKLKQEWKPAPPDMKLCAQVVVQEVFASLQGPLGPVTRWEACAGIEGDSFAGGVARSKSPGYPWVVEGLQNKKSMLGADGPYVEGPDYDKLMKACDELEESYRAGERGAVFRDTLKDEDRPVAKVLAGKTRLIAASPVHYSVVGRCQTLRFASAFMRARHLHGCMPGLNPMGVEASMLKERLTAHNPSGRIIEGDYSGFDTTQHPEVMQWIWDEISRRLVAHGCDAAVLAGIGRDFIFARHFGGDCYKSWLIYETDGTFPSGHFLTAIFNSIYNKVVLRYAWLLHKGGDLSALPSYNKHIADAVFGDDFIIGPGPGANDFNCSHIAKAAESLGMKVTAADGTDGSGDTHIDKALFLCRNFHTDHLGRVWMRLQLSSISSMFDWYKKSTPWHQHLSAVCRAALIELAPHDMEVFDEWSGKIYAAAKEHGVADAETTAPGMPQEYWRAVHRGHVPEWSLE